MARLETKHDFETPLKTEQKIYGTQNEITNSANLDHQKYSTHSEVEEQLTLSCEEFLIKKENLKT